MSQSDLIQHTAEYAKASLWGESSGHDWWHTRRVWRIAQQIARAKGADLFIVELAALLHDIADWKMHAGDSSMGARRAGQWLMELGLDADSTEQVCHIIANMSFRGAGVAPLPLSLAGQVVQDADRLDALGAIGIARTFAYGGAKGQPIHDPTLAPTEHATAESYLDSPGTSLNHFHEKLLLLKDRMHTATARALAEQRHQFMLDFLRQFHAEWNGAGAS